jgi:hypothetical protein
MHGAAMPHIDILLDQIVSTWKSSGLSKRKLALLTRTKPPPPGSTKGDVLHINTLKILGSAISPAITRELQPSRQSGGWRRAYSASTTIRPFPASARRLHPSKPASKTSFLCPNITMVCVITLYAPAYLRSLQRAGPVRRRPAGAEENDILCAGHRGAPVVLPGSSPHLPTPLRHSHILLDLLPPL